MHVIDLFMKNLGKLRFSCIGGLEVIEWAQLLSLKWRSRFMYFEVLIVEKSIIKFSVISHMRLKFQ